MSQINLETVRFEDLIRLEDAAKLFPDPPHINTVHKWARQRGLETVVVAKRRYTTEAAVREFLARQNAANDADAELAERGL